MSCNFAHGNIQVTDWRALLKKIRTVRSHSENNHYLLCMVGSPPVPHQCRTVRKIFANNDGCKTAKVVRCFFNVPMSGHLNQLLGQAQMADAFAKFSVMVTTSKLAYVKENKLYQALSGKQTGNGYQFSGSWRNFILCWNAHVRKFQRH